MRPLRLYINVDHVATVRQARHADEPDPLAAANRRIAIVVLRSVEQLISPSLSGTSSQVNPVTAIQPVEPVDGQKWSVQSLKIP